MARQKKPRNKPYRPRPVHVLAMANVIQRHHPMAEDQTTDLGIAYWTALDIHLRAPADTHWGVLASTMNIALILAERGHGIEGIDTIKDAIKGLQRAKDRAGTGKSWALDADAIFSVRTALQVHDEQVKSAKLIEMRDALREVRRRVMRGDAYGVEAA